MHSRALKSYLQNVICVVKKRIPLEAEMAESVIGARCSPCGPGYDPCLGQLRLLTVTRREFLIATAALLTFIITMTGR